MVALATRGWLSAPARENDSIGEKIYHATALVIENCRTIWASYRNITLIVEFCHVIKEAHH